jgi:hypothetical protein
MQGVDLNAFSLDVDTRELTRALKHLLRFEPRTKLAHLKYISGTLTVSMGRTSRDVSATGAWPKAVSVGRKWAEAQTKTPIEAAITVLRQADGFLHTRDNRVRCSLDTWTEESEALAGRREAIDGACRILARHKVTRREISVLIEEADPATARLWGPNDGRLIGEIGLLWKRLVAHGVEPSDIRRLIHSKSRDLWKSAGKSDADGYGPLAVTEREKSALIESGDLAKAGLWRPNDGRLIDDIALAWMQLVIYGVEPSEIRRLIDRKSH